MNYIDCTNHGVLVKSLDTKTPKKQKSRQAISSYTLGTAISKLKLDSCKWMEVRISLRQANADINIEYFIKVIRRTFDKYKKYLSYCIVPDYSGSERLHAHGVVAFRPTLEDGDAVLDIHEIYKHIIRNLKHNLGYSSICMLKYPDSFISYMFGLYTVGHDKYMYGSRLFEDRIITNIENLFTDTRKFIF